MIMPDVNCLNCGKVVHKRPSQVQRSPTGRFFCSSECNKTWRVGKPTSKREGMEVQCARCGKTFLQHPHKLIRQTRHFCSSECYHATRWGDSRAITVTCAYCGKDIVREPYQIKRRKYGQFCSPACAGKWVTENLFDDKSPAWKGGYSLWYKGNWKSQRSAARERDNHACQDCGITEQEWGYRLDVHHVRPYGEGNSHEEVHSLDNLVTLCRKCHAKRHKQDRLVKLDSAPA